MRSQKGRHSTPCRFDIDAKDEPTVKAIAERAAGMALDLEIKRSIQDFEMDITACHANGNPLRLADLLEADDFNFSHDVFGIYRHLDRVTGELMNHFRPRHSV